MRENTDAKGRKILDQIAEINKKLKKSLACGVACIRETMHLMREGQPLRRKVIPRITDPELRAKYIKIYENVEDLIDEHPRGETGQEEIMESLKKADAILE